MFTIRHQQKSYVIESRAAVNLMMKAQHAWKKGRFSESNALKSAAVAAEIEHASKSVSEGI